MQGTNAQRWDPWEPPSELLRSFPGWLRTVEMYSFTSEGWTFAIKTAGPCSLRRLSGKDLPSPLPRSAGGRRPLAALGLQTRHFALSLHRPVASPRRVCLQISLISSF